MIMAYFPDSLKWAIQKLEVSYKIRGSRSYLVDERFAVSNVVDFLRSLGSKANSL